MIRGYNYKTDCFILEGGKHISREMVEGMRFQYRQERRRAYWNALPWWKKLFKRKPI